MLKNKKQNGFALIEGLVAVLIMVIVGFGGYYVYHNQNTKSTTSSSSKDTSSTSPTSSSSSNTSSQQYFTIKEWGIKFKANDQTNDAYYVFPEESNNQHFLNLDSKDFDTLKAYDGSSCKGEYIALLNRYAKDDPVLKDPIQLGPVVSQKTAGNYVYTYSTHKEYASPCLYDANVNPIDANKTIYDAKVATYKTMFDTIKAE